MDLAMQAYVGLYDRQPQHEVMVKYHGGLKGYNATVRKTTRQIIFRLSPSFESCEPEIQIGVMQYLLNKLNRTRVETDNIDLYHAFLKKMSDLAPVTKSDPILAASFQRCNDKYFAGMMPQPNLVWGGMSRALLGTYTYATDTIMISQVLATDELLLDYVMYHEMLHKKHKFKHSCARTHSHTKEFRLDEAKFDDPHAETKLKAHLMRYRRAHVRPRPVREQKPNFVQRLLGWA